MFNATSLAKILHHKGLIGSKVVVDIGFGRRVLNNIDLIGQIVSAIGMIAVDICVDHITHLQVGLAQSQRELPRVQHHWDHQHAVATDHTTRWGGNSRPFPAM